MRSPGTWIQPDLFDYDMLNKDIYYAADGSPSHQPGASGCCDAGSKPFPVILPFPVGPDGVVLGPGWLAIP